MNLKVHNLIKNSPTYNNEITIKIDVENSTVGDLRFKKINLYRIKFRKYNKL